MTRTPPGDRALNSLLERLDSEDAQSEDAPAAWAEFLAAYSPLILQVARLLETDSDDVSAAFLFACEQLSRDRCRRLRRFQPDGPASFSTWLRAVVRNLCLDWRRKKLGRHRVFRSIANLPILDQEIFRRIYWDGLDQEAAFHALHTRFPGLTRERLAASAEEVRRALSSRQLGLLAERRQHVQSLDEGSPERGDAPREIAAPGPDPESLVLDWERRGWLDKALARLAEPDRLLIRLRFEQGLTLAEVARLTGLENAQRVDRQIRKVLTDLRGSFDG